MFMKQTQIAPARVSGLLEAAEAAARAIPPAFPLDATVAVNPVLGQTHEDLATASARLARVAGAALTRPRAAYAAEIAAGQITDDDLAAALIADGSPLKPHNLALLKAKATCDSPPPRALPTVAELAAKATGTDWPAIIERTVGLWAAGHFDRGQALWAPAPGRGAYAAWQDWASRDLTPEIAGLSGFCSHAATAPDTPERAILRAADSLGLSEAAAETAFHRLLMDLGGWAQHARWLLWQAELADTTDGTLAELLALRLIWDEGLLARFPEVGEAWQATLAAHAAPVTPTPDQVIDAILQQATERAHQRRMGAMLAGPAPAAAGPAGVAGGVLHRRALGGDPAGAGTPTPGDRDAGIRRLLRVACGAYGAWIGRGRGTSACPAEARTGRNQPGQPRGRPHQPDRGAGGAGLGPVPAGGGVVLRLRRIGRPAVWLDAGARRAGPDCARPGPRARPAADPRPVARGQGADGGNRAEGDEPDPRPRPRRDAGGARRRDGQQPASKRLSLRRVRRTFGRGVGPAAGRPSERSRNTGRAAGPWRRGAGGHGVPGRAARHHDRQDHAVRQRRRSAGEPA